VEKSKPLSSGGIIEASQQRAFVDNRSGHKQENPIETIIPL